MIDDRADGEPVEQGADSGPQAAAGEAPEGPPVQDIALTAGTVDAGWLRPRDRRPRGRPRATTLVLIVLWVALLIVYLQVHP